MNEYNVINTSQKKSDWNANEGEAGYIKNRTHYETVNETEVTHTFTIPDDYSSDEYEETNPEDDAIIQAIYNAYVADAEETDGNLVFISSGKIKINGTEHDCYLYLQKVSSESVWGVSYLDKKVDVSSLEDVYAAEFFVVSENPEEGKGILYDVRHFNIGQNEISCPITQTTVKKIDPKFLPDISGGGGDWNANEGEEGYIANRTHYTETTYYEHACTIPDDVSLESEWDTYNDYSPTDDDLFNTLYNTYIYGITSNVEDYGTIIINDTAYECRIYGYNNGSSWHLEFDDETEGYQYLIVDYQDDYKSITYNGSYRNGQNKTEVPLNIAHKLDLKYIPVADLNIPTALNNIMDATGLGGIIEGKLYGSNINVASGQYSHAEGNGTTASGDYSHAEGDTTTASGMRSHAEGNHTSATASSHAEGYNTNASGNYSHAEGGTTTAFGSFSHAEGDHTSATQNSSHAEGDGTTASGAYSHAEGYDTEASGNTSHAEGQKTNASGDYSHAEGNGSKALGDHSHSEGITTTASVYASHAEGSSTTASGSVSHAEGQGTTASGYVSHAEGSSTTASSDYSHAEGVATTASGNTSHAEGNRTTASGSFSHVEGFQTIANHESQHVFGEFNIADPSTTAANKRGNYVEIVGNGTSSAKSNARTLDWSGNEVLSGKLTVGTQPTNDNDVATKKYVDDHSGGGALICTLNQNVSPRVLDHTYGEIYNALLSGRSVFLNNGGNIYTAAKCEYIDGGNLYNIQFTGLAWNFLSGSANNYPTEDLD